MAWRETYGGGAGAWKCPVFLTYWAPNEVITVPETGVTLTFDPCPSPRYNVNNSSRHLPGGVPAPLSLSLIGSWHAELSRKWAVCVEIKEAVGQLEELPALCRVVDACCVGITWQARSIVWKEDVHRCCLGSGPGHTAYDARKLSLARPKESGWSIPLCCRMAPDLGLRIVRWPHALQTSMQALRAEGVPSLNPRPPWGSFATWVCSFSTTSLWCSFNSFFSDPYTAQCECQPVAILPSTPVHQLLPRGPQSYPRGLRPALPQSLFTQCKCQDQVQGDFGCRHEGEGVENLKLWRPAIINHLYWTSTPKGDPDVMKTEWQSKVNHGLDIHELDTPAFLYYAHPPLEGQTPNKGAAKTSWLTVCPSSQAF
eukprot:superscaffoldBa00001189_g9423